MPNWCMNTLTITGKPKDLSRLMKQVEITPSEETDDHSAQAFSCHKVIPQPANVDWYSWNTANWGSKWDCNSVQRDEGQWEEGKLIYYFDTAWSPVNPVIEALSKEHKKLLLTYTYFETGSDYWGEHEYKSGKELSEEGGSLSEAGCERQEYLLGDHHFCNDCYNEIQCEGESTKVLCVGCLAKDEELEKDLWKGEINESATQQQIEVA